MAELQCTVQKILNPEVAELTVGERFILDCQGVTPELDRKSTKLQLPEGEAHKLKLLRLDRKGSNEVRMEVLSDLVGNHQIIQAVLTDGTHSVALGPVQFQVASVQDPQAPVQEPYGSMGPLGLSIPWFYWMGFVLIVSLVGSLIAYRSYRQIQRRRLMQEVLNKAGVSSPESELFQNLRRLQRNSAFLLTPDQVADSTQAKEAVESLDQSYRMFLSRTFMIPATKWSTNQVIRTLQKEHKKLSLELIGRIRRNLRELDRASRTKLVGKDFAQLLEWVRDNAGEIAGRK